MTRKQRRLSSEIWEIPVEFPVLLGQQLQTIVRSWSEFQLGARSDELDELEDCLAPTIDIDIRNEQLVLLFDDQDQLFEEVYFFWDEPPESHRLFEDVSCSCDEAENDIVCPHLWLAAQHVLRQLQETDSPLRREFRKARGRDWKTRLQPLESFLQATRVESPESELAGRAEKKERRYIYRVGQAHALNIELYEQTIQKSGQWSKGRKVSWPRLLDEDEQRLSRVDQQVFSLVKDAYRPTSIYFWSSNNHGAIDQFRLLQALEGHDCVFTSTDPPEPARVQSTDVELSVQRVGSEYQLVPQIGGRPFSHFNLNWRHGKGMIASDLRAASGSAVIYFWETTELKSRLAQRLFTDPIQVPAKSVSELVSRLTQLERDFRVRYPDDLGGETVRGNPSLILRLIPRQVDSGLSLELWSKPHLCSPYFEPGDGPAVSAFWDNGQRCQVERDLAAELETAARCIANLGLDQFDSHRKWRWSLPGNDGMLDFLSQLRDTQSSDWTVEWANSSIPRPEVIGDIEPGQVQLEIEREHDWFGVEGTVHVGELQVPLLSVLQALRGNSRYVKLKDGKWARIAAEFRERLAALSDLLHEQRKGLAIDVTAAPALEDLFRDQQLAIQADNEWKAALQRLEQARRHQPQVPADLKAELRDYQLEGFRWLSRLAAWGVGGCLADDMGLGKTVQALALLLERRKLGPILVVAPLSVGFNWVEETERFAPALRPHLYRDTERGEFLGTVKAGDLVVVSYGLLLRDAEVFSNLRWGTLVIDEAQFIKNSRTKSAQIIRDLKADWRVALTGTPVENRLADLWSLFRAVTPGLFGSWERFRERFADPIEKQGLPERRQGLARLVRPFILRRTKENVLQELPPRTEVVVGVELSDAERKLYEDARLLALSQITGLDASNQQTRFQVLAMLTRLRQLACHPRLIDPQWKTDSAKMVALLEKVDEILAGQHRALIFSQFTSHLQLIADALKAREIPFVYLDGQTPAAERKRLVKKYQAGDSSLFLISLKAGGTGLNLTAADYVLHMDPWWNPAVEDQATDRAHRLGQTKPVVVYRLVTQGTIEEKILELHTHKRDLVAGVLEGTDQAGKLSTEELISLIQTNQAEKHVAPAATESDVATGRSGKRTRSAKKKVP